MEEYLAKRWATYLHKREHSSRYEQACVYFEDQKKSLQLFYLLFCGTQAKELKVADKHFIKKSRTFFEKLSGSGESATLCWQDDSALYLPPQLGYFPTKEQNELHYIWLIGMFCHIAPVIDEVKKQNLEASKILIKRYDGFQALYQAASEMFDWRSELSINPMWIYPSFAAGNFTCKDTEQHKGRRSNQITALQKRKQANQQIDKSKTDGMLVFLPESPTSFMELVNVDRAEDDSFDEDALENAEDLDAVTLGNKKADLLARVKMDLHLLASDEEVYPQIQEHCLDEWDYRRNGYLVGYAHICPLYQDEVEPITLPKRLLTIVKKIQNELDRMHLDRIKITNLLYGDRINLYRWIAYQSSEHKRDNTQRFYERFEKKSRDVATLILADTSLSTESGITQETSIIDVIKDALMVFSEALKRLEDRFAIYTFSSVKNKNIYFQTIKDFHQPYDDCSRGRIGGIKPGYYTRMGAAICESLQILKEEQTKNKLLLIVSDGKPNDIDRYDGKYGVEDTKKAILEAKKQQVVPFCITIDTEAKSYLPYIFGQNNYAVVYESEKLPQILSEIYIHLTK